MYKLTEHPIDLPHNPISIYNNLISDLWIFIYNLIQNSLSNYFDY